MITLQAGSDLRRGEALFRVAIGPTRRFYFLYLPTAPRGRGRPLILVHGVGRGAGRFIEIFRPHAEQYGATLIAPIFDKESFSGYQRLGLNDGSADREPPRVWLRYILDDVTALTGIKTKRFRLFGHSGGAQFVHRYAIAYPKDVRRYAISAAGWYTMPDPSATFPYGVTADPMLPSIAPDLDRFLRIPGCVLVGEHDTGRNGTLNTSERIDQTQGRTRVERAERWVAAMTAAACERGLKPRVQLHILSGVGHRFTGLAAAGSTSLASRFLFE